MDIAISAYEDISLAAQPTYRHLFVGGKFEGIDHFFQSHPNIIEEYTHFWLLDDDLVVPKSTVMNIIELLKYFSFPLSSPSLAPESYFSWPIMLQNKNFLVRATNFVEVIAPIMSADFLKRALPHFSESRNGWGYEWLWHRLLAEMSEPAAIFDCAPVVHTRPVGGGVLYKNGPPVNKFKEMQKFWTAHDLPSNIRFGNYFAVDHSFNLVDRDELGDAGSGGYDGVLKLNARPTAQRDAVAFLQRIKSLDENAGTRRVRQLVKGLPDAAEAGPLKALSIS
jgi:hypothetical protein